MSGPQRFAADCAHQNHLATNAHECTRIKKAVTRKNHKGQRGEPIGGICNHSNIFFSVSAFLAAYPA